jgi:hypothetical protein
VRNTAIALLTLIGLSVALAPTAAADFDRAAYLRCMATDAMSVGGLTIDSSTAAKLGAEAYAAVGGQPRTTSVQQPVITALAAQHRISTSVAALVVNCAQKSDS